MFMPYSKTMYRIVFLLLIATLNACSGKGTSDDTAIIPPQKMQEILLDIHLADGIANREGESNNSAESRTITLYKEVFAKYKISESQFYTSFNFYLQHADTLDKIYENIITEISKEQAQIKSETK